MRPPDATSLPLLVTGSEDQVASTACCVMDSPVLRAAWWASHWRYVLGAVVGPLLLNELLQMIRMWGLNHPEPPTNAGRLRGHAGAVRCQPHYPLCRCLWCSTALCRCLCACAQLHTWWSIGRCICVLAPNLIASGSDDKLIRLWDTPSGETTRVSLAAAWAVL